MGPPFFLGGSSVYQKLRSSFGVSATKVVRGLQDPSELPGLYYNFPMLVILLPFFLFLPLQSESLEHSLLVMEDSRVVDLPLLESGLEHSDARIRQQAVRAVGRMGLPRLSSRVEPLLRDSESAVRAEACLALMHLGVDPSWSSRLAQERDPSVRARILEAMGRQDSISDAHLLEAALSATPAERKGALRGLQDWTRRKRELSPTSLLPRLQEIIQKDGLALNRRLALSILLAAGKAAPAFLEARLVDEDAQVRMLAVRGLGSYHPDPSYLVRYEGLRASSDCRAAQGLLNDPSPHVRRLAIRTLGQGCANDRLLALARSSSDRLAAAEAVRALADAAPESLPNLIQRLRSDSHWRVRALLAAAAVKAGLESTRKEFLGDPSPNVVAQSLLRPEEALKVLQSDHYGLLMKALGMLEGWGEGERSVSALRALWQRITAQQKATSRDPRRLILERLSEFSPQALQELKPAPLDDFDPEVVALAERLLGTSSPNGNRFIQTRPLPGPETFQRLRGARARVRMRDSGTFLLELLSEEAPVTVLHFVEQSQAGYYDGLTFHRIEPNFVIQGGSPGANEYVGAPHFTRDEFSGLSHLRGTVGVSTRGRDTGDGQFFINLVDNYRLDHNYTLFARVIEGMDVVDRIQETDRIESIEILR